MDLTKIRLSTEEAALVTRADWILTKNGIIQKTMQLFGALQLEQKAWLNSLKNGLPAEVINTSPKISKGENYQGLPWLMLDYPRLFNKEDSFAIRNFFWWGNFFSATLQLSGIYKNAFESQLVQSYIPFRTGDFFVCIHEDPWQHHFDPDNYLPVQKFSAEEWKVLITTKGFTKISKTIPLQEWNNAQKKLMEIFSQLLRPLTG